MQKFRTEVLKVTLILGFMVVVISCTDNKAKDSKAVAEKSNEDKFDDQDEKKDAQFLVEAAEINMRKINLGKLAQQKNTNIQVADLGKMMESTNGKSHLELEALAKTKNVKIPSTQTQDGLDDYHELNDKTGNDFSKAYSDMMVSTHKNAIKLYEEAASDSEDPEIRSWASNTLPTLRSHLDEAKKCKEVSDKT